MADALALASILGFDVSGVATAALDTWYISDPRHDEYGSPVPAAALGSPDLTVRRGDHALVRIGDSWTTAIKLSAGKSWDKYVEDDER